MRTWKNLAAPDDPTAWYDVDGVWPTKRGTYERVHFGASSSAAATGTAAVSYAFAAGRFASTSFYVVDASKIWEDDGGGGTVYGDVTNGVTVGAYPMMAQYGLVTICVMGAANPTVKATASSGNFSALAGAPQGAIIVVQSNCVLILNTNTSVDGWAASDVGDYTNWTTGEAASGRLIATPGPITAAVAYGDSVIVFKSNSVYRMRYVGGAVKWMTELIYNGVGCSLNGSPGTVVTYEKYSACASPSGVLFTAPNGYWWMDGAGQFQRVSEFTTVPVTIGFMRYAQDHDIYSVYSTVTNTIVFYSPSMNAWGYSSSPNDAAGVARPAMGNSEGLTENRNAMPLSYYRGTNTIIRYVPSASTVGKSCYLQTSMVGRADAKTKWTRVIPLLRRRTDKGSDVAALSVSYYREREGLAGTTTQSVTESTQRRRFDLNTSDNFARFKVTWTDLDVEVDDFQIIGTPAGLE